MRRLTIPFPPVYTLASVNRPSNITECPLIRCIDIDGDLIAVGANASIFLWRVGLSEELLLTLFHIGPLSLRFLRKSNSVDKLASLGSMEVPL